jgi:hypothetical protein
MRKLDPTINGRDLGIKANTFFQYASHDKHIVSTLYLSLYSSMPLTLLQCQTYAKCSDKFSGDVFPDDDVKYVSKFLDREYYVH